MRAEELPLWERTLIASYRWRQVRPVPRARLRQPVAACRVAIVTTAGLVPPGVPPFDLGRLGGDATFRVIPADADLTRLDLQHRSQAFDRGAALRDPNVAFPLDRLRDLVAAGEAGEVAPRHLTFMGSITAPARLRKEHAPAAADVLVADAVDVALLAPV
ncbi:MAG: glycine/sarcosine/betaine reductase selenoprotein B family protein [Vicinamibacterales bacterium]